MSRVTAFLFGALLSCASAASAQTDIYLKTEHAGRGKLPIVVKQIEAAASSQRDAAQGLTAVIRDDLEYSGLFSVIEGRGQGDTL